jgi:hypothetical protein
MDCEYVNESLIGWSVTVKALILTRGGPLSVIVVVAGRSSAS